jgi:hypothetical protein
MNRNTFHFKKTRGQALAEIVLVIPILFLMAAGLSQFWIFFTAKAYLEQACGQTARLYAAGALNGNDHLADQIWLALGPGRRFFSPSNIDVTGTSTSTMLSNSFLPAINNIPPPIGPLIAKATGSLLNYTGQKWIIRARFDALPLFRVLFPAGLSVTTQMAVLKYPAQE